MLLQDTVAAIATAPGNSGIAIIRISGDQSYAIVDKVFRPIHSETSLQKRKGYTAALGDFLYKDKVVDQGICLFFRAPHSYTGEDVIEINCHGGSAVTHEILRACYEAGAKPAEAGEFTKRAVLNGRISLTQAEAVMDMIETQSKQGIQIAKNMMAGNLYQEIAQIKQSLIQLAAHVTAWIDYPEEGVEDLENHQFSNIIADNIQKLDSLLLHYDRGRVILKGIQAVIVGSPNVGKSTIFNILTGYENAIVTPVAGTTRDVIRQQINIGDMVLNIADTAGIHETQDIVEKEGIRRSKKEFQQADLILAVFDGSLPLDQGQKELAVQCAGKLSLAIINKTDIGKNIHTDELEDYFTKVIEVSAYQDAIFDVIEKSILELLDLTDFDSNAPVLINERQYIATNKARQALQEAQQVLESGLTLDAADVCLEDAILSLSELSGENVTDAVLEEVFSKFCVGK